MRVWCENWGVFGRIDRTNLLSTKQLKKFDFERFFHPTAAFLIENLTQIVQITQINAVDVLEGLAIYDLRLTIYDLFFGVDGV